MAYRALVEEIRGKGSPVELFVLKNSDHGLTARQQYCADQITAKGCREQVQYSETGLLLGGRAITRADGFRRCGDKGYHCGYGTMELYPEMLAKVQEFLRRSLASPPPKQ